MQVEEPQDCGIAAVPAQRGIVGRIKQFLRKELLSMVCGHSAKQRGRHSGNF
jgi:hypothetical protein